LKTSKKDKHFIHKPIYPGGPRALWSFIRKHLQYPKDAIPHQVSGIVRLRYAINNKGVVTETQVIHSLGYGCDEEAERVVKLLKYEVPRHRKIKVKFHRTINIRFSPPKPRKIQVNLVKKQEGPKNEDEARKKDNDRGGYEYTITFGPTN
jgi:protein TonB